MHALRLFYPRLVANLQPHRLWCKRMHWATTASKCIKYQPRSIMIHGLAYSIYSRKTNQQTSSSSSAWKNFKKKKENIKVHTMSIMLSITRPIRARLYIGTSCIPRLYRPGMGVSCGYRNPIPSHRTAGIDDMLTCMVLYFTYSTTS